MKIIGSFILVITIFVIALPGYGQNSIRALFLGNSYTAANNLPQMIADAALSCGDTLFFDSNTPGGYTFQGHSTNQSSLNKIAAGNWDYVVLQEQSQLPSFPLPQVMSQVYPYAGQLNQYIKQHNACAETVFFMTWGRKNGDASNCATWPPVCTYEGMDSLLRQRYMMLADSNNAIVSPVGAVWRYIRKFHPDIELYEADESHPSIAGSYAAACTFYAVMFKEDPMMITWNSILSSSDAAIIRQAAADVAYDSLSHWFVGTYNPIANFSHTPVSPNTITFTNLSENASHYHWDFGDGDTSTLENPVHQYAGDGQYQVQLKALHCGNSDSISHTIIITGTGIKNPEKNGDIIVYPNPASDFLIVKTNAGQPAGKLRLEIFSVAGNLLFLKNIEQKTTTVISTEHLTDGFYFYRITGTNNQYRSGRVIIRR